MCPEKWGLLTLRTPSGLSSALKEGQGNAGRETRSSWPPLREAVGYRSCNAHYTPGPLDPALTCALMGLSGPKSQSTWLLPHLGLSQHSLCHHQSYSFHEIWGLQSYQQEQLSAVVGLV